jgi:hypothetical protein
MWPNANIGIATGTISGFFVLDIDGEEGEDSLAELEGQYGALPDTVEQLTGHGRHILFKQPQGIDVRPKVALLSGLDIRGDGGYIVAAPSLHISGKRYAWEVEHHPLSTPIVEAPQWLLELIIGQGDRETAATAGPNEWATALDELVEGKRNDGLYRYACHLLAHGLSAVEAVKIVRAINNAYAKPPLDKAELDRTLQSAIEWKAKNDGRR